MDRIACFEELLELTDMQCRVLQNEDIEAFHDLLKQRQVLIDKINSIEDLALEDNEKEILIKIQQLDSENVKTIKVLYESVKQDARRLRQAKKSILSYEIGYNPVEIGGYYFDKKQK